MTSSSSLVFRKLLLLAPSTLLLLLASALLLLLLLSAFEPLWFLPELWLRVVTRLLVTGVDLERNIYDTHFLVFVTDPIKME